MPANSEGRAAAASGCTALTAVVEEEEKSGADGSVSSTGFSVLCGTGVMGLRVRPPLAIFCCSLDSDVDGAGVADANDEVGLVDREERVVDDLALEAAAS